MDLYPSLRENKHLFCTDILFIITNHPQDSTLAVLADLSYTVHSLRARSARCKPFN